MAEIKFDLGKNIVDTAKASGVPSFQVSETAGLIDYSINGIPKDVVAYYTRPGYEINWRPIFAFTMYADRDISPNLSVETATLQFDNRTVKTHAEAQALIEQTIAQFQRGKWQRYSDPEWDVLLTGRSSMLDEHGHIGGELNTIDPAYKIPAEDWPLVADESPTWRWVGDGVLASLHVLGYKSSSGLDYTITLDFDLLDVKLKRDAENLAQKHKAGDAKGWNSTAQYEADKKNRAALNKRLIENAIKRGDAVVSPSPLK
ncbi:hypothetical protein ACN9M1_19815 [Ralstonia sp. R-29]|uniref:hypothetical protein n=1 Tax=Ralstonia sp. R-29 TaxID=3404059 RepID=UPI003CF49C12